MTSVAQHAAEKIIENKLSDALQLLALTKRLDRPAAVEDCIRRAAELIGEAQTQLHTLSRPGDP